jgi:hypothetical protein
MPLLPEARGVRAYPSLLCSTRQSTEEAPRNLTRCNTFLAPRCSVRPPTPLLEHTITFGKWMSSFHSCVTKAMITVWRLEGCSCPLFLDELNT